MYRNVLKTHDRAPLQEIMVSPVETHGRVSKKKMNCFFKKTHDRTPLQEIMVSPVESHGRVTERFGTIHILCK